MNMDDNLDTKPPFMDGAGPPQMNGGEPSGQSQQQPSISSFYPLPPMRYIKQFTENNVRNRSTPFPPRPFTNGTYLMFGQNIAIDDMIIRSLESQNLRRLYPREYDHKRELKKINASILVNFLDLIDVLIYCPDTQKREEKCNDLQLLFITMHHLINELRPHQARESIRVCLKMQKKQRQDTTQRLVKQIERVQDIIRSAVRNVKDRDISSLLQETLPENFETKPKTESTTPSSASISKTLPFSFQPPSTNNSHQHETLASLLTNSRKDDRTDLQKSSLTKSNSIASNDNDPLSGNNRSSPISRMSELDAFMCDLVDETF